MSRDATPADVIAGRARWCVVEGDNSDALAALPAGSCSALVTDPPAGIGFMGRHWDKDRGGRAQWVAWLAGVLGLARAAVRSGGRAFVWALPRTTHWTGCAVEDAGWSIETVVTHLFGTGWPKGQGQLKPSSEHWYLARTGPSTPLNVDACRVTAGGPSPSIARRAAAERTGNTPAGKTTSGGWEMRNSAEHYTSARPGEALGRWPPNTVFSHSPGCERVGERKVVSASTNTGRGVGGFTRTLGAQAGNCGYADPDGTELVEAWRCVEGCPVAVLDAQSGDSVSNERPRFNGSRPVTASKNADATHVTGGFDDSGTASRFFPCFPADDFAYIAKPSKAEKRAGLTDAHGSHCTVKPVALMTWLVRLITEPGDLVLDPFGGSGTTGVAALREGRRVILVERDPAFAEIARARLEHVAPDARTLTARVAEPISAPAPDFGPLFGPR